MLRKAGRLAEAEPYYTRALGIAERAHGPEHLETARAALEVGDVARALGRLDDARRHHLRALEILAATPADPGTWQELGEALLADGAPARAVIALEQALSRAEPAARPRLRFDLARALWDAGDNRTRARALAEQARADTSDPDTARALDVWLADHR